MGVFFKFLELFFIEKLNISIKRYYIFFLFDIFEYCWFSVIVILFLKGKFVGILKINYYCYFCKFLGKNLNLKVK